MAGTTPVITLIEEVPLFIQISKSEFRPIWVHITRLTKSRFINLCFDLGIFGSKGQMMINFEIYTSSKCDSCTQSLFN